MLPPNNSRGSLNSDTHLVPDGPGTAIARRPEHDTHSHVPVNATAGTGRILVFAVAGLALALAVGFLYRHHEQTVAENSLRSNTQSLVDAPAPVDVVRVSTASPVHTLALPGETRAWYQSTIYARVSGYIGVWRADIGDKVKKGQELALIETPELDDQLKAAEAKVQADQSEVTVADANSAFAESTYKRWKESGKGVVSEQEREQKKAEYLSGVARQKSATSQVQLDQAEVNRLTDLANFKKVVAPYDGVITSRRIDIGDLVTAGNTASNTQLYDIAQSDKIRVYVDVPQAASTDVKDGAEATVTAEQYPGRTFVGKVSRNSQAIDPAAKTLRVEVDLDNQDMTLKPGMYAEVAFQTTETKPPLRIPAGALSFRSEGPTVAVVDKAGVVHFRDVTIARDMGNFVEIGSGLSDGDMVAINISNQIADGDKVDAVSGAGAHDRSPESKQPTALADQTH